MKNKFLISIFTIIALTMVFPPDVFAANGASLNNPDQSIVLAVEKDYPPFLFSKNGIVQGIAYDYTKLIAQKLEKKLETTEPMQLQALLDAVKSGSANLVADITKTPERDQYLEFSDSYVSTPAVVIGRKDPLKVSNKLLSDSGIKIAVGKGYGVVYFLKQTYPDATYVELDSDKNVVEAVSFGAADVGVLDTGSLTYVLQNEPLSNIEVLQNTGFSYQLSFAVLESQKDFIPQINKVIAEITPEERSAIYVKWIPNVFNSSTSSVMQRSALYIGISGLLAFVAFIWSLTLRRKVSFKTKQLNDLNRGLDSAIQEKKHEFEVLQNQTLQKSEDLENTKKAILNILEDVQDEKTKLSQVTDRLSLATKSANIGIWDWNVLTNTLEANDQFYQLYGATPKSFQKAYEGVLSFVHPDDQSNFIKSFQEKIEGKDQLLDIHFRIIKKDTSVRYLKTLAQIQRSSDGRPVKMIGVQYDETKEQEIDKAKSEFVSLASHQLRTPLTAIRWYAEMLVSGDAGELNPDQKQYISEILIGNQRMLDLVNSLLNVSRLELGTFIIESKPMDILSMCENAINEQKFQIDSKKISFSVSMDKNIPLVPADEKLLYMVVQNLLSNAVKYTPEGGKISFNLKMDEKKKVIQLSVSDTGYGIPKNQEDKIFAKLFRADNVRAKDTEGTGLGLYIVKQIMDQSGGKVWFDSKENIGTTFFVELPLSGMKNKAGTKALS